MALRATLLNWRRSKAPSVPQVASPFFRGGGDSGIAPNWPRPPNLDAGAMTSPAVTIILRGYKDRVAAAVGRWTLQCACEAVSARVWVTLAAAPPLPRPAEWPPSAIAF